MSKRSVLCVFLASLIVLSGFLVSCSSGFPKMPSDQSVGRGVEYLANVQAADGSIGSYPDTAWAVMALAASGNSPKNFGSPSPVEYLVQNNHELLESFNPAADLARSILAILAAGDSPQYFGAGNAAVPEGDFVKALASLHDGRQFGATESINEDFWAVTALVGAGYALDDPIITSTVDYIIENKGVDKGWSWAAPCNEWYYESDPDNTAAAIIALTNAGFNSSDDCIQEALQYLKSSQGGNGGFISFGVENTSSTAWVISALAELGEDPLAWQKNGSDPVAFVLNMQAEDGSFQYASPLPEGFLALPEKTTADSITALLGSGYPVKNVAATPWWLWAVLVFLIASMITFLYLNAKRRRK